MSNTGVKPFSLQSPELIAKQYEGNKQKIAQAIQLGLVDATAGTLAGMFIDRMRAAAITEQGPPQTVAQQVLGSKPPVPPPGGPPMQPQMGGSPPPPMPAPQGAPPASPAAPMGGPPVRAADGGLMSIPIPDAMFDEPESAGMARGGLVAFDGGGPVLDPEGSILQQLGHHFLIGGSPEEKAAAAQRARDFMRQTGRSVASDISDSVGGITPAKNRKAPPKDLGSNFDFNDPNMISNLMYGMDPRSRRADTSPEPTPKQASNEHSVYAPTANENITPTDVLKATYATGKATVQGGKQGLAALAPAALAAQKAGSKKTEQIANAVKQATGKDTEAGESKDPMQDAIDKVRKYYRDPEYEKFMNGQESRLSKQKKEDVWSTLAQIGFGMAASKSPTFLGAIGEAGTAAMPGVEKALQARRAAEGDLAKQRMETRRAEVTSGIGVAQNQAELKQKQAIADREYEFGVKKLGVEERIAQGNQAATRYAASQRQMSPYEYQNQQVDKLAQRYMQDATYLRKHGLDPAQMDNSAYLSRADVKDKVNRLAQNANIYAMQEYNKAVALSRPQQQFNPLVPVGGGGGGGGNGVTDFSGLN